MADPRWRTTTLADIAAALCVPHAARAVHGNDPVLPAAFVLLALAGVRDCRGIRDDDELSQLFLLAPFNISHLSTYHSASHAARLMAAHPQHSHVTHWSHIGGAQPHSVVVGGSPLAALGDGVTAMRDAAHAFPKLVALELLNCGNGGPALIELACGTLRSLLVTGFVNEASRSAAIARCSQLRRLAIAQHNCIDVETFASCFRALPKLRHLTLSGMKLGDDELLPVIRAIRESGVPLVTLDLSDNQLDDTGAESIAHLALATPSLAGVALKNNYVGDAGANEFAEGLSSSHSRLRRLDLSYNQVTG
jgi:hypothetical protein